MNENTNEATTGRTLKEFGDYSDRIEYVNQEQDYGDCLRGEWWYADDETLTIYFGTFGNHNSPGADQYTHSMVYEDVEEYKAEVDNWTSYPEYSQEYLDECEEEEEEEEDQEALDDATYCPSEDDLFTNDGLMFVYCNKVAFRVGSESDAADAYQLWCNRNGIWPTVWMAEERGGFHVYEFEV